MADTLRHLMQSHTVIRTGKTFYLLQICKDIYSAPLVIINNVMCHFLGREVSSTCASLVIAAKERVVHSLRTKLIFAPFTDPFGRTCF